MQLRALAGSTGRYHDFNVSHLAELLARDEGINLSRSTPVPVADRASHSQPRITCRAIKRMQRECKSAEGMMLQTDASPPDWLEGRGQEMDLLGAIDDATGKVVFAQFRSQGQYYPTTDESQRGAAADTGRTLGRRGRSDKPRDGIVRVPSSD